MNVPRFPEFKSVGLEDRDVIQPYIDLYAPEVCEMNFANTFIWRQFDYPRFTFINDNLCLLFDPPNESDYFLQPMGCTDLPGTILTCLSLAPRLSRIPASFASRYCSGLRCAPDRDNFDYVYATSDLIELKGKKFDGKRNRINKFERCYAYKYFCLTPDHLQDCRRLFEEWLIGKDQANCTIQAQKDAIGEGLTHFEALRLAGGAIEVEGKIAAFSIGGRLSAETAVIHIEIVNPKYEGLAQLMNREFVRNELAAYALINREQDLGLPGLRRAKLSYHPHHLVEKYGISK